MNAIGVIVKSGVITGLARVYGVLVGGQVVARMVSRFRYLSGMKAREKMMIIITAMRTRVKFSLFVYSMV